MDLLCEPQDPFSDVQCAMLCSLEMIVVLAAPRQQLLGDSQHSTWFARITSQDKIH